MASVIEGVSFFLRNMVADNSREQERRILNMQRQSKCEEFEQIKSRIEAFVSIDNPGIEGESVIDIPVNFRFPKNFVRQRMRYVKNDVEWRDFASGLNEHGKTVISGQIKFGPNAELAPTYHKNAITYIYVVTGQLIEKTSGKVVNPYIEVPYEIKPAQKYNLYNPGEVDCHFVIKYVMI